MANNSPTRSITSSSDHASSSSTSADKIRSRFLRKIGIDTPPPQSKPPIVLQCSNGIPPTSFPANGFPILEPLKIALESDDDDDDDSSFDSSCDNDNCDNSSEGPLNPLSHQCNDQSSSLDLPSNKNENGQGSQVEMEYFHKKPHRRGSLHEPKKDSSFDSNSKNRETTPQPLQDHSLHSLPSLTASDESSSAQLCNSVSSNKKPRFDRNTQPKKKKGVTIHKTVAVVHIPSRLDYSNRIKESMWTTSSELATNATRNTIEFASEGWNWRNVIEDENMLVHQGNGELIHPIHIHNALSCTSPASEEDMKANLNLIASLVPNRPTTTTTPTPDTANAATAKLTLEKDSNDKDNSDATPSHAIA